MAEGLCYDVQNQMPSLMFSIHPKKIPGCYELQPYKHEDKRGSFVKTFHQPTFEALGLCTAFIEEYYSVSYRNVVRGMHFQVPPNDLSKLIYCVEGQVLDAFVDLRRGSPTFGEFDLVEISCAKANSVYIPKGIAHGFCVKSERAIIVYKVSAVYSRDHDKGILWNSVNIPWEVANPVLSERDLLFPQFQFFESPFLYEK